MNLQHSTAASHGLQVGSSELEPDYRQEQHRIVLRLINGDACKKV